MATIQIADNDARVQYTQAVVANTTQLTIDYPFFSLDDINVIVTNAAGTDTVLTRGTGTGTFAVVGVAVDDGFSGGYITLGDSYSAGTDTFTIFRDIPVERTTDFPTSGPFNISSLNTELDKIIAIEQELETKVTRTLQLADSDATVDLKLPNLDTRKGTTLAFNATTGVPEAGPTISGVNTVAALAADIATLADIEDGTVATDAISDAAAIASDITTVSGISSNVSAVAGNASNINAVNANSSNINTVAGINANVTTVAGISSNVTTAAGISADITAVAADASDIGTVSSNISNVNTVAGISADVSTVAADGTDIGVVAGISSDVTTVSGISSNVTTVAGISANVTAVAGDATDIGTVATNIANVNTVAGISSNVTTVAGIAADVTAAATNVSDIQAISTAIADVITVANDLNEATSEIDTVANSIANVDLVGGSIANVNTVATNLTDINSFANTYFISATAPVSPTTGDLWFDTTASTMKVYDGSGFVNAGSSVNGTSARYSYTATASQTSFAATYDAGYVDVYLNGVKLVSGTDFTATDGSTVVLATGAALNDTVDIIGYGTFSISSAVTLPDNVKATFGTGSDMEIYHNPSSSDVNRIDLDGNMLSIVQKGINGQLRLKNNYSATANTHLDFYNQSNWFGSIGSNTDNSVRYSVYDSYGGHDFRTNSGNFAARIDNSANLLVGTTSTPSTLISATSGGGIALDPNSFSAWNREATASNHSHLVLNQTGVDAQYLQFRKDGSTVGSIGSYAGLYTNIGTSDVGLMFNTGAQSIIPHNMSTNATRDNAIDLGQNGIRWKDLWLSGGVYLGGTGSANLLDDYEEGTWNVSVTGQSTNGSAGTAAGTYTKVGRKVTASVYFTCDQSPSGTNALFISGLPFAATVNQTVNITIHNWDTSGVTGNGIVTPFIGMSFYGDLYSTGFYVRTTSNAVNPYYQETLLKTGSYIRFNVTYHTT
jgi:hypothetical protein